MHRRIWIPLALAASAAWAAAPSTTELARRDIDSAVTNIALDETTLGKLGLVVEQTGTKAARHAPHPLSVAPASSPWFDLAAGSHAGVTVAWDGFRGFDGDLVHRGGFVLRAGSTRLDFSRLTLRPRADATELDLVDAQGTAWLRTNNPQWEMGESGRLLRYLNADVVILPALARVLGDERYTEMTVGVLAVDARLSPGGLPAAPPPAGNAPPPCGDWSGTIDVALTNMSNFSQAGVATVNGRSVVVVLPSADLQNVGTANVPWYSKFTNLGVAPWNDQHPFLVWQMVRIAGGVLEPLGRSDLKHAFLTLNNGCSAGACTDSHVLGLGCTDVYSTSTNNSTASLAPRAEVSAFTGIWSHCGGIPSHFDTNGDCVQDFSGAGENAFTHGLKAAESDLQVAGATYFVEAFYIIRDDSNIFNSMGYRQVTPSKPGSTWTFANAGAYTQGPAINAWVNPTTPGPDADNRVLDTGEGHLQLAVRVADVAGSPGVKRYAYALQNHDFDRQVKSFKVPFDTTIGTITNVTFADGDGFAVNDWTATTDPTGITWTAPASTTPPAELDYASVYSFRFDVDRAATATTAAITPLESGAQATYSIQTLAPGGGTLPTGDSFFTVTPCRILDTRTAGGGAAPITANVEKLVTVAGSCGVPAGATAVAFNVTAVGSSADGEIAVYASGSPTTHGVVAFRANTVRANNGIAMLSGDGKLGVKPLMAAGSTHAVVDITGYFGPP